MTILPVCDTNDQQLTDYALKLSALDIAQKLFNNQASMLLTAYGIFNGKGLYDYCVFLKAELETTVPVPVSLHHAHLMTSQLSLEYVVIHIIEL